MVEFRKKAGPTGRFAAILADDTLMVKAVEGSARRRLSSFSLATEAAYQADG